MLRRGHIELLQIDTRVLMYKNISLAYDLPPRYLGMKCLKLGRHFASGLTDDLNGPLDGQYAHVVRTELIIANVLHETHYNMRVLPHHPTGSSGCRL